MCVGAPYEYIGADAEVEQQQPQQQPQPQEQCENGPSRIFLPSGDTGQRQAALRSMLGRLANESNLQAAAFLAGPDLSCLVSALDSFSCSHFWTRQWSSRSWPSILRGSLHLNHHPPTPSLPRRHVAPEAADVCRQLPLLPTYSTTVCPATASHRGASLPRARGGAR